MRTVLLLAQWYPPCEAWPTAATRAQLLASHLPEHEWQPVVLVPDLTGGVCRCGWCDDPHRPPPTDPAGTSVDRLPVRPSTLRAARSALVSVRGGQRRQPPSGSGGRPSLAEVAWLLGDTHSNWARVAARAAGRVLDRGTVDALWTTSAPFAHLQLGQRLAKRYDLPWVADLRDPVSRDVTAPPGWLDAAVRLRRRTYRRALLQADAITAATGQVVSVDQSWLGRRPELLIPGFDDDVWAAARSQDSSRASRDRFEVVFTGRLYENYRRPDVFLEGLGLLADRLEPADRDRLRFVYYGRSGPFLRELADRLGCADLVEDRGFVEPAAVPVLSARATALLLLTNDAGDSGVPGGKFFEYLAAHRPILAVPGSDQYVASVFSRTGAGVVASGKEDAADCLGRWFSRWRREGALPFEGDAAAIEEFSARRSARRFADVLNEVVARRASNPSDTRVRVSSAP